MQKPKKKPASGTNKKGPKVGHDQSVPHMQEVKRMGGLVAQWVGV